MSTLPAGQYCWGADTGDLYAGGSATATSGALVYDVATSDQLQINSTTPYNFTSDPLFLDADAGGVFSDYSMPYVKPRMRINIKSKKDNVLAYAYYPSGDYYVKPLLSTNRKTINISLKKKSKVRDVLFTNGVAFGLASCRDLVFDAQRQKERNKFKPIIYITGRQSGKSSYVRDIITRRLEAQVVHPNAQCRMTLVDEAPYKKRPCINIVCNPKVGVINLKNGSTIYTVTDEGEYKHVTGKSTKLLNVDYSPWTSDTYANGFDLGSSLNMWDNDLTDIGSITFRSRPCINFRSKNGSEGTIRLNNSDEIQWRNQDIENAPIDMISSMNRSYALESLRDESKNILDECTGYDETNTISRGANLAGSIPTSNLMIDTDSIGVWAGKKRRHTITIKLKESDVLTYEGLMKAKKMIEDEGY